MPGHGAAWELRATVPVLYTHQKGNRRPIFREGSLRIACGRIALVDDSGRELDEDTLTKALLEQIQAGEEIDFPGHLVRPDATDVMHKLNNDTPSQTMRTHPAPTSPCSTSEVLKQHQNLRAEPPTEKKGAKPFKRPRLLTPSTVSETPLKPAAMEHQNGNALPPAMEHQNGNFLLPAMEASGGSVPVKELHHNEKVLPRAMDARPISVQPGLVDLWIESVDDKSPPKWDPHSLGPDLWAECVMEDAAYQKLCRDVHFNRPQEHSQHLIHSLPLGASDHTPGGSNLGLEQDANTHSLCTGQCDSGESHLSQQHEQQQQSEVVLSSNSGGVAQVESYAGSFPEEVPHEGEPQRDEAEDVRDLHSLEDEQAPPSSSDRGEEEQHGEKEVEDEEDQIGLAADQQASCGDAEFGVVNNQAADIDDSLEDPIASTPPQFTGYGAWNKRVEVTKEPYTWDSDDERLRAVPLTHAPSGIFEAAASDATAANAELGNVNGEFEEDAAEADSDDEAMLADLVNPADEAAAGEPSFVNRRLGREEMKPHGKKGSKRQRGSEEPDFNESSQPQKSRSNVKDMAPPPPPIALPLHFAESCPAMKESLPSRPFTSRGEYARHFMGAVTYEMQIKLCEIAVSWSSMERGASPKNALPRDVAVVVRNVLVGLASGAERNATLLFTQRTSIVMGDTRACGRGDIWILLPPGGQTPLLMRSLWRGVSPKGRLLCTAANSSAVAWLDMQASQGRTRMTGMTGLASGGFDAELAHADALQAFADSPGDSGIALDRLLGISSSSPRPATSGPEKPLPFGVMDSPELSVLSPEQAGVVRTAVSWALGASESSPVLLVRGVFGSGKSRTLAACIVMLDRLLTARKDPRRILLVCQTNVAVDAVLQSLLTRQAWDKFARLGSFKGVDPSLLYRTVSLMKDRQAAVKELRDALQQRPKEVRESLNSAIERGILPPKVIVWRRQRLLASTTAALLAAEHFGPEAVRAPIVFVDEATQLTEPSVFCALRRVGAEKVLLVGDPLQLPARAESPVLRYSQLERLWDHMPDARRVELATQYRCHPAIADLGSSLFYGGWLRNGVTAEERATVLGPGAPPLAVMLSEGAEARAGPSFLHDAEARFCAAWLGRAINCSRLKGQDVGIICLYRAQADACARALASAGLRDVQAATVDAFQGGEREVIVLSCGRSSAVASGDTTFASCPRRLNVALSRARRHLVIVGGEAFLNSHPYLGRVVASARSLGTLHLTRKVLPL